MVDRSSPASAGEPSIVVAVESDEWMNALPDAEAICRSAAAAALRSLAPDVAARTEVSLVLSDDAAVRALNREWRGQDKPTNVLSFPGDMNASTTGTPILLGDVIVALETVRREVEIDGTAASLADHLTHLIVHGVLHLLGYDHEADDEADRMERLETQLLAGLGVPDPYEDHERRPD